MAKFRKFSYFVATINILPFLFLVNALAQPPSTRGFDPDDPPETTIEIAPYLTFGGQIEFEYLLQRNLDLDKENDEDISSLEPGLTLAFSFDPSEHFQAFTSMKLFLEYMEEDGDKIEDSVGFEIEQAYFLFMDILEDGAGFQVGRQRFEDEREWLYDEELDGVRLMYDISFYSIEFSVTRKNLASRDLFNPDEEENINNYILYGKYENEEDEIETILGAYLIYRDGKDVEDGEPLFAGIHANGDINESAGYWLELAGVFSKEENEDIRAFGFDIGLMYELDLPAEPTLTLAYAFGTGDGNEDDNKDTNFRQTGLQSNESSFNGVPDFNYYGEALDPELSNLSIITAGFGINPIEEGSIDLVYHYYFQNKLADNLMDSALDAEPDGESRDIGNEIDLIIGYEIENKFEAALRLGYFIPGDAFGSDAANSFTGKFEIQYEF